MAPNERRVFLVHERTNMTFGLYPITLIIFFESKTHNSTFKLLVRRQGAARLCGGLVGDGMYSSAAVMTHSD